jgi:cellulose biosynthesis protein BcsQ
MIISFVQTKGGTGKSTLAMNTAFSEFISSKFTNIALVELDPQGTLKKWWDERYENNREAGKVSFHHLSSTQKEVIQETVKTISSHNELLILDVPGESTSKLHTKFACAVSDIVIIPMRTSTNDESAFSENLLPIIKEIVRSYPIKKGVFQVLPSFTNAQTNKEKITGYFTDILPEYVHTMNSIYPFRAIYENFNREGANLNEFLLSSAGNKRLTLIGNKALKDIEAIVEEIYLKLMERKNVHTEET